MESHHSAVSWKRNMTNNTNQYTAYGKAILKHDKINEDFDGSYRDMLKVTSTSRNASDDL